MVWFAKNRQPGVRMQINKPRANNQPLGINNSLRLQMGHIPPQDRYGVGFHKHSRMESRAA